MCGILFYINLTVTTNEKSKVETCNIKKEQRKKIVENQETKIAVRNTREKKQ